MLPFTSIGRQKTTVILGYARTSTADQHAGVEAQQRDLRAAGVEKLWSEQVSSVAQRDQLKASLPAKGTC